MQTVEAEVTVAPSLKEAPTNGPLAQRPATPAPAARSIAVGNLAGALSMAQGRCRAAARDSTNTFHRYRYASAEVIIQEAKEALRETGLALAPVEMTLNGFESSGENRYELHRKFLLLHTSGESLPLAVNWPVVPERGRPLDKATAIADTSSLAYLLRDLLQMPRVDPEDDLAGREERPQAEPTPPQHAAPPAPTTKKAEPPTTAATGMEKTPEQEAFYEEVKEKFKGKADYFKEWLGIIGVTRVGAVPSSLLPIARLLAFFQVRRAWFESGRHQRKLPLITQTPEEQAETYQALRETFEK